MGRLKSLGFCLIVCIVLNACGPDKYEKTYSEIDEKDISKYVGAKACISCHREEVDKWQGSHHDLAMQIANDSTVLGDFNDVKTELDGVSYFFYKKNKEFFVRIKEIDNSDTEYKIAYTFGVDPLQQYLIDFDRGRKQVLRATWDTEENKWYHQYSGDAIEPTDWLHWSRGAQNWNTMCAECHSTNLQKNYTLENDAFNTTYSEINVSCESCHGPAYKHVDWANNDPIGENTFILKGIDPKEQINLCAPCHARRVKLTADLEPGMSFEDQYRLQTLSPNFYHRDGQILEEDYVYGSFRQSKMYAEGVKCNDCHDSHSLELKFEGNQLCLQCHLPEKYDSNEHHFHAENTEASLCISCHMTGAVYMGNDFRRDHSFRIPRPDQSISFGTPNACTQCHDDKSDQWASNNIKKWYGVTRGKHFSDALLVSSKAEIGYSERAMLDQFISDLQFPSIARATVIENLNYTDQDQINVLLKALNDPSPMIRYQALMKFRELSLQIRTSIAIKFASDPAKMVRIGAAQLVIGLDENTLGTNDIMNLSASRKELETMLFSNADFSTGRMQLGDYYLQKNELNSAIENYQMALQKDSLLTPVYSNLSVAYSMNKNYEDAGKTLDLWMLLEPELSRPHYLKALLNFEIKKIEEAVAEFKEAIRLNPNDTRSMYNLATFYYQDKKDLLLAENYINTALRIEPGNQDYKYLLAFIYKEQGHIQKAQAIMDALRATPRE
jgi:tetratricopeptide (TPR) repeat protein